jgi:hypothetical protein
MPASCLRRFLEPAGSRRDGRAVLHMRKLALAE